MIFLHIGVYAAFWWWRPSDPVFAIPLAVLLIWASVIDVERFEIPDLASGLLALSGAIWALTGSPLLIIDHLVGAILWPGLFLTTELAYRRFRGRPGLGFGDVKLMVGIGLWVGYLGTIWVVLYAALGGIAVLLLAFLVRRWDVSGLQKSAVAFGAFLCLSAWVVWLTIAVS